jgi:hypothetical protein
VNERLLRDMQRASEAIDAADSPGEYQVRCVALALIARQFVREAAALLSLPVPTEKEKIEDFGLPVVHRAGLRDYGHD